KKEEEGRRGGERGKRREGGERERDGEEGKERGRAKEEREGRGKKGGEERGRGAREEPWRHQAREATRDWSDRLLPDRE
ncbi:hypothetical protein ACC720_39355, partial [Rhizobium ruizarguesonis]